MKKILSLAFILILPIGCGSSEGNEKQTATDTTENKKQIETSFKDGVLILNDLELTIKNSEVIEDEYSDNTLILFEYELLNKNLDDLDMITANLLFKAYQDNDPNIENELRIGSMPTKYHDVQSQKIKKGGKINGAVTYILTDKKTDVNLKAFINWDELVGETVYEIKK